MKRTSRPPKRRIRSSCTRPRPSGTATVNPLRIVAGRRQSANGPRPDVRPAERERARHHQVRRLGLRQQTLPLDAVPARGRRRAQPRQAREARRQPQDDVPDRRPSTTHPATRAPRRDARRQARLAAARLCLHPFDPRYSPRRLRRNDRLPVQRAQLARQLRPCPAQHRRRFRHARARRRARPVRDRSGNERASRTPQDRSGRSSALSTNRKSTSRSAFRFRRGICSSACRSGPRSSAGRSELRKSAR